MPKKKKGGLKFTSKLDAKKIVAVPKEEPKVEAAPSPSKPVESFAFGGFDMGEASNPVVAEESNKANDMFSFGDMP